MAGPALILYYLGTGKTHGFRETILPQLHCPGGVYIGTSDPKDFEGVTGINYLPEGFTLSQEELAKLPTDSLVFYGKDRQGLDRRLI